MKDSFVRGLGRLAKMAYTGLPTWTRRQIALYAPSSSTYRALSTCIAKERPDVAILRLGASFRYIQRLRRNFPGLKICIEFNSTIFDESFKGILAERQWRYEETRQLTYADTISVVSHYLSRYLLSMYPSLHDRVFVNPNGVDIGLFRPADDVASARSRKEMGIPTDAIVLGYVGGMEPFRQLPRVISQIAALRRNGLGRLFLVIIGDGQDLCNVRKIIAQHSDLGNWIYCPGSWIEYQHIPFLISAFDVGIFPYSNLYGSPQKIFEYMACAIPVIGPDVPAVTEVFSSEHIPLLIRQDGTNFDQVVSQVYYNLRDYKKSALNNRKVIESKFTWKANVSRVMDSLDLNYF